jgi:hypothetical protein
MDVLYRIKTIFFDCSIDIKREREREAILLFPMLTPVNRR